MSAFRFGVLFVLIHFTQQIQVMKVSKYRGAYDDVFFPETYTSTDENSFSYSYGLGTESTYISMLKYYEKTCAEEPSTDFRCGCDPDCAIYGNCCPDSIYFKAEEQKLGASLAKCYNHTGNYFYVMIRCPASWEDPQTRHRCEQPDDSYPNPTLDTLITSLRTNVTYRNSYCASCHNDLHQDVVFWPLTTHCEFNSDRLKKIDTVQYIDRMVYDVKESHWCLDLGGLEIDRQCVSCSLSLFVEDNTYTFAVSCPSPFPVYFPKGTKSSCVLHQRPHIPMSLYGRLRFCEESISSCDPDWNDTSEIELCVAYSAHMKTCDHTYRNYHCALCNHDVHEKQCEQEDTTQHSDPFDDEQSVSKIQEPKTGCNGGTVYDSLSHECVTFLPYQKGTKMETGSCTNISIRKEEYTLTNENSTVFVPALNATFYQHEFFLQNGLLVLCLLARAVPRYYPTLGYITMVGLALSITCIILHLTVLCLLPKLIDLPSLNLASLCVSLLLLYSSFISSAIVYPRTTSCVVVAAIIHYSLLATFFWMLIISFDIFSMAWRTKSAFKGIQTKRFLVYSVGGWLIPALIEGSAVILDSFAPNSSFSPGYGEWTCWFSHSNALLLFCLAPLVLIVCLNVMFFLWSSYLIRHARHSVNTLVTHTNFKANLHLFIIMVLTWISGIIAAIVGAEALWHIFVVSNTTQCVFILIAFSCNRKVRQDLQDRFKKGSGFNEHNTL